jgi:hypothetical protein
VNGENYKVPQIFRDSFINIPGMECFILFIFKKNKKTDRSFLILGLFLLMPQDISNKCTFFKENVLTVKAVNG